ncbi:PREDICTED: serine/threonine-kinase, partial [Prunus dulcis]
MEYLLGGDMMTLLIGEETLTETVARFYIAQSVMAIESIHKHNYIHSNLDGNIILEGESSKLKEDGAHRSISSAAAKWPNVEEVVNAPYDHHQPKIFLPKWDIIFTVSSTFAVFVDPLSCYVPVVISDSTWYYWDQTLMIAHATIGNQTLMIAHATICYGMDILVFIKRRRGNGNAKPFGASWIKFFGGPHSRICKVLNGQKSLRFLRILPRICAALPVLQ